MTDIMSDTQASHKVPHEASIELANLLLQSFNAPLETIAAELEKLEQSQFGWLARIDQGNSKFLQTDESLKEAILLIQQAPAYTAKLQAMKKDMAALSNQTKDLVSRMNKLKQKRQKEIQERMEKDRLLLAQPAEATPPPASSGEAYPAPSKPLSTPL